LVQLNADEVQLFHIAHSLDGLGLYGIDGISLPAFQSLHKQLDRSAASKLLYGCHSNEAVSCVQIQFLTTKRQIHPLTYQSIERIQWIDQGQRARVKEVPKGEESA
jgi:hypothetical protein